MNKPESSLFEVMRTSHWRRVLASALYVTLLSGPLLAEAGTIAESPLFVSPPVPADVVFLLDDSGSMNTYTLQSAAGTTASSSVTAATITTLNGVTIPTLNWLAESPALNPLWYNPAITYTPWSNDGAISYFPNADFGGPMQVADQTRLTQQDMRYILVSGVPTRVNSGTGLIGSANDLSVPLPRSIDRALGVSNLAAAYYPAMPMGYLPEGRDLFSRQLSAGGSVCAVTIPCPPGDLITPAPVYNPATETYSQPPSYCTVSTCSQVIPQSGMPQDAPAVYFIWDGVAGTKSDPGHYRYVEVARYIGIGTPSALTPATSGNNLFTSVDTNGNVVHRSDCVTNANAAGAIGGTCTFTEEAQNYANWFTYYRSRLFAAIAVTSQAMSSFTDNAHASLRIGYGQINNFTGQPAPWDPYASSSKVALPSTLDGAANRGALVRGIRPFTVGGTDRQQVFDWLFGLSAFGNTPSREALDAIGRYYTRSDSAGPWGDTPGTATLPPTSGSSATNTLNGCRRAYTILTTDGEWTSGSTANAPQPVLGTGATPGTAVPGLDAGAATPLNAADTDNLTKLIGSGSDSGDSFTYHKGNFADIVSASAGSSAGNTDATMTAVAMYYWNRDLQPGIPNALQIGDGTVDPAFWQHMSTFAVAYGLSAPEDTAANRALIAANNAAIAGGTNVAAAIHWPAVDTSPSTITGGNRIDDVFRATMASGGDFYSAANPQQLSNDIGSAFAQFSAVTASGTSVGAPGVNLFANDEVFTASFKTQVWTGSLNAYLASTYVPALAAKVTPAPLWSASIPTARNLYTQTTAGGAAYPFSASTPQVANLFRVPGMNPDMVSYLAGDRSLEGSKYRVRASLLGDIVDSSPYYSGVVDFGYGAQPAGNGGGAIYSNYLTRIANRAPLIYVGANDGIWHAFAASTGQEVFGYVPRALLPSTANQQITALTSPGYQHQFFVDGATTEGDVYLTGSWYRYAVGSTGVGPPSLFAIFTSNLAGAGSNGPQWEITPTEEPALGHMLGAGVIGMSRNASNGVADSVYLNGNGFDSSGGTATLLIRKMRLGTALTSITVDNGPGNGLGPVSVVYDSARSITTAYAGDAKGQLWKFDLSANNASAWNIANNGKPLFQATPGPPYQPITVAPRLAVNPGGGYSVSFGTGQLFEVGDNANISPQSIYSIIDNGSSGTTITPSMLTDLSIVKNADGSLSINAPSATSALGFALKLTALAGERVIRPAVINGDQVDFTSYAPSDPSGTLCGPSASSYFYQLNLSNGRGVGSSVTGTVGGYTLLQLQPGNSAAAASAATTTPTGSVTASVKPSSWNSATTTASTRQCVAAGVSVSGSSSAASPQCITAPVLRVWRQPLKAPS